MGDGSNRLIPTQGINPDGEMEDLIWKEIPGYENMYEVSQFGDVKSKARFKDSGHRTKDLILKKKKGTSERKKRPLTERGDIWTVTVMKDGKQRCFSVAKLVVCLHGDPEYGKLNLDERSFFVDYHDGDHDNLYYKNLLPSSIHVIKKRMGRDLGILRKGVKCKNKHGDEFTFESQQKVAEIFGVSKTILQYWIRHSGTYYRGYRWTHAALPWKDEE